MNQWTVFNDSINPFSHTVNEEVKTTSQGMQGEAIPYKLYSDGNVISALAIGFLLIVAAMQNDNKSLWRLFRNCIITPGRSSLFDNGNNQTYILPTILLCITSAIMCGLITYIHQWYSSPELFGAANHMAMMGVYISVFILFLTAKWIIYAITDWIFFDKEKRKLWHKSFFNIISSLGLVLFGIAVCMVFFESKFHFSSIIILITIILSKILLFYNCIKYFFRRIYGSLHLILYFCTLEIMPDLVLWKSFELINSVLI